MVVTAFGRHSLRAAGQVAVRMPRMCDGLIYGIFKIDSKRRPVRLLILAAGPGASLICHLALLFCHNRRTAALPPLLLYQSFLCLPAVA